MATFPAGSCPTMIEAGTKDIESDVVVSDTILSFRTTLAKGPTYTVIFLSETSSESLGADTTTFLDWPRANGARLGHRDMATTGICEVDDARELICINPRRAARRRDLMIMTCLIIRRVSIDLFDSNS